MSNELKQFATADEVAKMFRVSKARIYDWARTGTLPFFRVGPRKMMFDTKAIESWASDGGSVKTASKNHAT